MPSALLHHNYVIVPSHLCLLCQYSFVCSEVIILYLYVPVFSFQCSDEELHLDADEIFALVLRDSEFDGHFSHVRQEDILPAVTEALHALYHTVPPRTGLRAVTVEVSTTACMVVSVLTQWLVRHFVKQLLQLITSEAVCMHHRKIPPSYIQNYLNHQHHFSLKALLESRHTLVQSKGYVCLNRLYVANVNAEHLKCSI